jgi:hypothetical protein
MQGSSVVVVPAVVSASAVGEVGAVSLDGDILATMTPAMATSRKTMQANNAAM